MSNQSPDTCPVCGAEPQIDFGDTRKYRCGACYVGEYDKFVMGCDMDVALERGRELAEAHAEKAKLLAELSLVKSSYPDVAIMAQLRQRVAELEVWQREAIVAMKNATDRIQSDGKEIDQLCARVAELEDKTTPRFRLTTLKDTE